jgi:sugar/nucleoside kinase (ribokinase family)
MAMHKAEYKTVYGETSDMNMINVIKRIGFPVEVSKLGTDEHGRQIYRGTVNV